MLVSIENVIFQRVYKSRFGLIPFFLACFRCVRLLASTVTTSVTSNMHSLMPYHIEIQAAGLLWNNSIDNSIQEEHHKTKNMFYFLCSSTTVCTPPFRRHHAKSKCTTDDQVTFSVFFSLIRMSVGLQELEYMQQQRSL